MKIRVFGHSGESKFPFGASGPWKEFEKVLISRGNEICGVDIHEEADAIIAHSFNENIRKYIEEQEITKAKCILVLWEPYIVETVRYKIEVLSLFGAIFAPSIEWAEKVNAIPFNWPQGEITDADIFKEWNERENKAVMIQGNKFSARKGEQYSLRRRVISSLGASRLDLFGTKWNEGIHFDLLHWIVSLCNSQLKDISPNSHFGIGKKYINYFGPTDDKHMILSRYKIAIVIENSLDFVSEKLFDSIRAGCVSVYVGPSLGKFGIPNESAIQVDGKSEVVASVIKSLLEKSDQELEKIARNQRLSLRKVSENWNNTSVLSKLASDMADIFESN
jgi:hypothetical protein